MPLKYISEVLHQTSDFDSFQLLPRSILSLGMASWAGVIKTHMHSFPNLIKNHNLGLVVVRTNIYYLKPYEFFAGDAFTVTNEMWITEDRKHFFWDISFKSEAGEKFAALEGVGRAVKIDPASWGAVPTRIESPILDFFKTEDYYLDKIGRPVEVKVKALREQIPIAQNEIAKRIYRHECEAADQWSFIEIGSNAANAREELLLESKPPEEKIALVKGLLNKPLSKVNTIIKRPLFLFDNYTIDSSLYHVEGEFHVVHKFLSTVGRTKEFAVVIESY